MKIAYAFRRGTFYPFVAGQGWSLPGGDTRTRYLRHVKDIGFDGIELGSTDSAGSRPTTARLSSSPRSLPTPVFHAW